MAEEEALKDLLIERYPKRGMLVELSYPETKGYLIFNEIQKRINEQDPDAEKHFLFIDLFSLEDTIELNENIRGGNKKEQSFFKKLQDLWAIQEKILTAMRNEITVLVSHYIFDLILTAYSENMFDCRENTDRIAYANLLAFFKRLAVPDLVLSFGEYPRNIETQFNALCDAKLMSPKEQNKDIVIYSKLFQKESARDTLGRFFDDLRPAESDLISLHTHCFSSILSIRCQKEFTRIKFY